MKRDDTSPARLPIVQDERRHAAHEDGAWLAILRGLPSSQAVALTARGYGRTAVLFLQNACESRCFFCASPGVNAPAPDTITKASEIDAWLADARDAMLDRVCIAGTEPARHPSFEHALETLARGGMPPVEVMTSGFSLAEPETPRRWHTHGVRSVAVPLYSADEAVHDAIVGTPGAHARVTRGLDAARAAGIEVFVHTLALNRTLGELAALATLTRARWSARLAVGIARPKVDAWAWESGAPTLGALAATVVGLDVSLVGFPTCVAIGSPRGAATVIELYFRTNATVLAPVCATCDERASCPGVLPEELARHPILRPIR